jgi:dephospho-CoA kinase
LANQMKIGVCGGIACGKSTLSKCMAELLDDCYIVNVDLVAHQVYERNIDNVIGDLETEFGSGIISIENDKKSINRKALGGIVFGNKEKLDKLSAMVWPRVKKLVLEEIEHTKHYKYIIFEASILIEAGWMDLFDTIWCFSCKPEIACDRLMKRNNLTQEEALKRIHSHISNQDREKHANVVIHTDADIETVKNDVKQKIQNTFY